MTIEEVARSYSHARWANERVLEAAASVPSEAFSRRIESSFASLRETLVHLVFAEWLWLERLSGRSPDAAFDLAEFPSVVEVGARWRRVMAEFAAHLETLTDADLDRRVRYLNLAGEVWEYSVADILQQVTLHAAYHRGQVATLLRQLGVSPVATDLLVFLDDQIARA